MASSVESTVDYAIMRICPFTRPFQTVSLLSWCIEVDGLVPHAYSRESCQRVNVTF